jgi:hypothetical protein
MSENTQDITGGVRSTSVKVTLNAKSLGVDAFISLEETFEFTELATDFDALQRRQDIAEVLVEQALTQVKATSEQVQKYAAENPRGHVSVHAVNAAPPAGVAAGTVASGPVVQQVTQVANGAATTAGGGWLTAPDRFDAGKTVRFLSSSVYSTDQMKQDVYSWLSGKGLNPQCFEIWDERTGPRGAEAGNPISSVANVKIAEPYRAQVPAEVTFTDRGGVKAVARAKFNSDGSLYIWLDKVAEAAHKYGALSVISAGSTSVEENPFG